MRCVFGVKVVKGLQLGVDKSKKKRFKNVIAVEIQKKQHVGKRIGNNTLHAVPSGASPIYMHRNSYLTFLYDGVLRPSRPNLPHTNLTHLAQLFTALFDGQRKLP